MIESDDRRALVGYESLTDFAFVVVIMRSSSLLTCEEEEEDEEEE